MKIETVADIKKLPSVLEVAEVSARLIELVDAIRKTGVPPIEGAQAINDLISYQGYSEEVISLTASKLVIEWTKETYDSEDNELIEWHTANVVNMTRSEAVEFFRRRMEADITHFERNEIEGCLADIGIET
ncbi:hypothetical protein [Gilvimarinus algae]|uniref:Uncharacterized protein n=1 Tax=Gilvimarinus algae TaxID=3058037 RepID=A0ABT8TI33_9GAMM|nr:hypothetical protein [Gilvimarinus sp. SDUM040014]MDO3383761.1 hypothetical protein [Gilvimarinus sp. SDUM040014]